MMIVAYFVRPLLDRSRRGNSLPSEVFFRYASLTPLLIGRASRRMTHWHFFFWRIIPSHRRKLRHFFRSSLASENQNRTDRQRKPLKAIGQVCSQANPPEAYEPQTGIHKHSHTHTLALFSMFPGRSQCFDSTSPKCYEHYRRDDSDYYSI